METSLRDLPMECRAAVELTPWLLGGSLEEGERRALLDHVSTCDSCRIELEETAGAWQLLTAHVPSLALAQYGLGLEPDELDRDRIERHLALCPACRRELEWVRADRVADFEEARAVRTERSRGRRDAEEAPRRSRWHQWAIAASFVALLASGGWYWTRLGSGSPASTGEVATGTIPEATATAEPASGVRERTQEGRAPGMDALFRDGFESGSVIGWSTSQSGKPPEPRSKRRI